MLKNYLKVAWRNALINRSYTLISLSSLVLGITLFFFITLWVKDELSYDKNLKSPEKICRIETNTVMQDGTTNKLQTVGWPIGKILSEQYPEVESLTYMKEWAPVIYFNDTHFYEDALYADKDFFKVFGYELQEGNTSNALSEPYSLIITQTLKEKYFKNQDALGQVLMINDTIPYKITGVFKKLSASSHLKFDMIGSFSTYCARYPQDCNREFASGWFDVNVYNYVRLRKTASPQMAESKIKNLVLQKGKDAVAATGFKPTLSLTPVSKIYLYSNMPTAKGPVGNIKTVNLFLVIGIFILIIACLNFINLTTAKSLDRAKEIGIKKVLGSNSKKLIFQFLTEAALSCSIAAVVSIIMMIVLLPLFNQFSGKLFTISTLFSAGNILMMSAVILLLIPLSGFYPAWVLSSFKPIAVLKGKFAHSASGSLLRKGLVVTQFVISAGFIMSTIIIWKQMEFMQNQNLGFDKNNILILDANKIPWKLRHENAPAFKATLLNEAGIKNITASAATPGRSGWNSQFAYPEGQPKDAQIIVEYLPVDEEYVKTVGLQFAAGRDFLPGSKVDSAEALLINETAAKLFGWANANNAIGKKLSTSGKEGRIIGVLKDYHQHGLQEKINPVVLGVAEFINVFALRYQSITPKQAIAAVQTAWNKVYRGYPLEYRFMDEDFRRQYQKEDKLKNFFGLAAMLSIFIACMGLLGLAIYTAQKREKEIGVRKVLGASVTSIVALLSKDFLKLVMIAIIIASPVAWLAMNKWLEDFAYRTHISWWMFVLAGLTTLLIALVAVSFQAIKAAIANPVKSLRTE